MSRTRTFIGIDISDEIRSAAATLQHDLARHVSAVNWVAHDNMHITLLFLGDIEDNDLHQVCRIARSVVTAQTPFEIQITGVSGFPTPRRPKTLWAGLTEGTAETIRLHNKLEEKLLTLGSLRREERSYTPHLTLGRIKTDGDSHVLASIVPQLASWTAGRMKVHEIVIYGSVLRRHGPEYTVIAREPVGKK